MIRSAQAVLMVLWAVPLAAQAPFQEFRLDSGLRCLLLESHEQPLIRMELVSQWDPAEVPAGKQGLAGFLALALQAGGAGPYNRAGFNRAVDALGLRFAFDARMGAYRWTLVADSRAQESAMELLLDAVGRPDFDGPLVEGQRQALIKQAGSMGEREQAEARFLWNCGDPGTLMPPGVASVDRVEFKDLLDFRRRVVRPEGSTLLLYGDLNLVQAKQLVLMHFGVWGPEPQAPVAGTGARAASAAEPQPRLLAVLEASPETQLWAAAAGLEDPFRPAVRALLPILLARSANTFFRDLGTTFLVPPGDRSPLLIKARVPRADRDSLVPGVAAALEGLRDRGFTSDDLAAALIQWKAENAALALHPERLLRRKVEGGLEPGLDRAVASLTVHELNRVVRAWLDPKRLRFLLLGADAPMLQAAEKAGLGPGSAKP